MKISSLKRFDRGRPGTSAFTLAEMLCAVTVFGMVIAAMIATMIFGMRIYTLAATKLTATAGCRKALNTIRDQVKEAKLVNIGICASGPASFNPLGLTNYQVGNALELSLTNNWTNGFTLYYLDTSTSTNKLMQCTVTNIGSSTNLTYINTNILASYITNSDIFAAQDFQGQNLTNDNTADDNLLEAIPNRLIVCVKLQFYQWEYPIAQVGSSNAWNAYDYYQLRTKITRRAWN